MLVLPRHIYNLEVLGQVVLGVSMLTRHQPVHPVVLPVYSHGYVGGLCSAEYLRSHSRHIIGDGFRTGEISRNKAAALCSKVKPSGGEHGFGATHVHHHLRLLVIFHLHVCHL